MFIELTDLKTRRKVLINLENINSMEFSKATKELEVVTVKRNYRFDCDECLYKELKKRLHIIL